MHWIMQGWGLKTRILETMHSPEKHSTANICDSLLNARTNFGVWSKSGESKITQSEEAVSSDKLAYLAAKPSLDAPVLMSDCGSDISVGGKRQPFGLQSPCISLFEHNCESSYENSCH